MNRIKIEQLSGEKKSFCAVYLSKIPKKISYKPLLPTFRQEEVDGIKNEKVKREKYWVWQTLAYALQNETGFSMDELQFSKSKEGKWTADKVCFSLSHSFDVVAVILSNDAVGIDVEAVAPFCKRFEEEAALSRFQEKVLCKGERVEDIDQLLTVWTKKESVYKQRGKGGFLPHLIQAEGKSFQTKIGGEEYRISLIKEGDCPVQFFLFDGKEAKGLEVEEI